MNTETITLTQLVRDRPWNDLKLLVALPMEGSGTDIFFPVQKTDAVRYLRMYNVKEITFQKTKDLFIIKSVSKNGLQQKTNH